jgi:hypothetical protein
LEPCVIPVAEPGLTLDISKTDPIGPKSVCP